MMAVEATVAKPEAVATVAKQALEAPPVAQATALQVELAGRAAVAPVAGVQDLGATMPVQDPEPMSSLESWTASVWWSATEFEK